MNPDDYILIGKVVATFGLKGAVKVLTSGDILEVLQEPIHVYLNLPLSQNSIKPIKLEKFWKAANVFVFIMDGFSTIEEAEVIVGTKIYVRKDKIPLNSDDFFVYQLLGLYPKSNDILYKEFKVVEVMDNPAHPILRFIDDNKQEILIPFVNRFVGEVNIDNGFIEIFDWVDFDHN
ncbi:MAG: 16S rRNA processing protein RimM [Leptospiraceae bacterium]|nr:16S rRNA processing protein RimM [Leptospiraceae bacterium]MCP5495425.1 16S rRNA processing protein RimM [Leptospiraceae bacterium]